MTPFAVKDYNRARSYLADLANRRSVPIFENVDEAIACVINKIEHPHQDCNTWSLFLCIYRHFFINIHSKHVSLRFLKIWIVHFKRRRPLEWVLISLIICMFLFLCLCLSLNFTWWKIFYFGGLYFNRSYFIVRQHFHIWIGKHYLMQGIEDDIRKFTKHDLSSPRSHLLYFWSI